MAIKKNSKINFYKFVQVKVPNVSAKTKMELKPIISNTVAINNLGATVNSIAVIVKDFKKIQLEKLVLSRKSLKDFEANYTKTKKQKPFSGFSPAALVKKKSWLEGLFKMLSGLIKAAIVIPALKWLSDPANRDKVARFIEVLSKLATFIFKVSKFGVVNTIEGLYTLMSDASSPWEKIGGLVQGLTGLGTLLLGLRWLSNPTRIITDFGNVLIFLHNNLIRGRRGLIGRAGALGLIAATAYGGYKLYEYLKEDGTGGRPDPNDDGSQAAANISIGDSGNVTVDKDGNLSGAVDFTLGETVNIQLNMDTDEDDTKSKGNWFTNLFKSTGGVLPSFAKGGWISGPQSGYGVSLDGGRSTSFIGHGTEYVARKSDGGAFIVPFDTPGTKTQPNLTDKRISEARSLGFDLDGFSNGGTLPKGMLLSQKAAFDHVYNLAKLVGGAKYPEIVAAQAMHESNYLDPRTNSVYNATNRTNAFGQTGDRGFGTIIRKGFKVGWSKYDNLSRAVGDNIKLWHDVANNKENYNAFGNILDGIAAVAPAYSPNADPENIKKGYTTDAYSKGMIRALKVGGFDISGMKDKTPKSSSNSGSGRRPTGNIFSNFMGGVKSFFGFGDKPESNNKKTKTQNKVNAVKPASHPDTGSGFTVGGTRDQSGRPLVFSQPAAQMFAAAMRDSGIDLASFIASTGRSKSKNTEIGGDPNSHHLYGEALDINGEGYQWLKANGRRFGWQYGYNHNPDSAHFKYVGAKAGTTPILSEPGKDYAGGNSLHGHIGEGAREGGRRDGGKGITDADLTAKKIGMGNLFGNQGGGGQNKSMFPGNDRSGQFQQTRQQKRLENQTKERNNARRQISERSQEMIKEVMAAVAQQNGVNSQAIQAANTALAAVAGQTGGGQPQMIPSGSGGVGSIASTLQSTLNPLRGLLR
ncbi:WLM domain-containing protein [Prochlorococcus phage P-SSM7]|uniref:WLM domain-containing protein n=1 Tax=Prochlorococcus phage P-SSM7 TaxID=445688 RepID=E3SP17_9CAUD|nr:endolysin [Prochlorococcus phage P-SSM7]ADO99091.1 WLM domain-containing protein [Prochlorococcus phage P-SSM7]